MEKFEAGDKFLELFVKRPTDFSVKEETGRDHNCIVIKNNYRAVEVVIDIRGNNHTASSLGNGEIIRYIRQDTVNRLYDLAKEHLAQARIQRQVDADNKAIAILFDFYKDK